MIFSQIGTTLAAAILIIPEVLALSVINYNVVVPPSAATHLVGVAINDDIYPLTQNPDTPLLFSGWAPGEKPYQYVVVDSMTAQSVLDFERFKRPAILTQNSTYNEVFGRPWNQLSLPPLPKVYDYLYPVKSSKLYEDGQIATIHFQADPREIEHMHNATQEEIFVIGKMSYIGYDNVQQFSEVKIKIGGHSTRSWAKVPYKLKINKEFSPDGLYGRYHLKLRSEATDPTIIREKLYADMLQATGVVTSQGAYVRLFLNDKPVGIFLLVDDITSKQFIRQSLYGGEKADVGFLIKGDAGKGEYAADLFYRGANSSAYDTNTYEVRVDGDPEGAAMNKLVEFMSFINTYKATNTDSDLAAWNTWLDVDTYMRSMVMEWLTGNWDAHAYSGNNYALYHKTEANQYVYLPMDFDYTFGNGLEQDQVVLATENSDKFTANRPTHSYLYEKLMKIPSFKSKYDTILKDVVTKMFSSQIIDPRLRGLAYMLQREVMWDQSLKRQSVGKSRPWKADEYLSSFDVGGKDVDLLYGVRQWIALKERAVKLQLGLIQAPPTSSNDNGGVGETETDALHGGTANLAILQPF